MVVETIQDNGSGYVQFNLVADPNQPYNRYELMGGTGYENAESTLAKNDRMTPTTAPNDDLFRIYFEPNAAGIAHDANMADLPKQVYTTSQVLANSNSGANIVTTVQVSSLSAGLQAALPLTLAAGSGGLADGLECDLAYMTYPKNRNTSYSLRNVGSSYNYRNAPSIVTGKQQQV